MGSIADKTDVFSSRRAMADDLRNQGKLPDAQRSAEEVLAHTIVPAEMPRDESATLASPSTTAVVVHESPSMTQVVKKAPDERTVVLANLKAAEFDLENAIAQLVRESDGSARTIPKFKEIHGTLRSCLRKLAE